MARIEAAFLFAQDYACKQIFLFTPLNREIASGSTFIPRNQVKVLYDDRASFVGQGQGSDEKGFVRMVTLFGSFGTATFIFETLKNKRLKYTETDRSWIWKLLHSVDLFDCEQQPLNFQLGRIICGIDTLHGLA